MAQPGWGIPALLAACSAAVLRARDLRQGCPRTGGSRGCDKGCREVGRQVCSRAHKGVWWGHGGSREGGGQHRKHRGQCRCVKGQKSEV